MGKNHENTVHRKIKMFLKDMKSCLCSFIHGKSHVHKTATEMLHIIFHVGKNSKDAGETQSLYKVVWHATMETLDYIYKPTIRLVGSSSSIIYLNSNRQCTPLPSIYRKHTEHITFEKCHQEYNIIIFTGTPKVFQQQEFFLLFFLNQMPTILLTHLHGHLFPGLALEDLRLVSLLFDCKSNQLFKTVLRSIKVVLTFPRPCR